MSVNFEQVPELHFFSQSILQSSSCVKNSLLLALNVVLRDQHLLDVRLAGIDVDAWVFLDGRPTVALSCDWDRVQVKSCGDALKHTLRCQLRAHTCVDKKNRCEKEVVGSVVKKLDFGVQMQEFVLKMS